MFFSSVSASTEYEENDADTKPFASLTHHQARMLPRSAMLLSGKTDVPASIGRVVEGNINLLLQRDIGVAEFVISTQSSCVSPLIRKL